ncbi:hypothetical protein PHMEG_00022049 [Phytophthora megakarya]|uniref:Eukaryotic/viral aspartic protease n=1 Tax=Phytophthora megakarya TaxID=4795 RepID=A0A225VJP2_9STRA|nr:hypothetical protein PHMEG_00022049 [Phytophthora megakarya]
MSDNIDEEIFQPSTQPMTKRRMYEAPKAILRRAERTSEHDQYISPSPDIVDPGRKATGDPTTRLSDTKTEASPEFQNIPEYAETDDEVIL